MIRFLQVLFTLVLVTMLAVTGWASTHTAIWQIPPSVIGHPWFIATLFDTYFAFLVFWGWVAYKERTILARIAWLVAILLLGNIAIAVYMLIQLWKLPPGSRIQDLLIRR
jgi:hypothetical protein